MGKHIKVQNRVCIIFSVENLGRTGQVKSSETVDTFKTKVKKVGSLKFPCRI